MMRSRWGSVLELSSVERDLLRISAYLHFTADRMHPFDGVSRDLALGIYLQRYVS
jgi:hypothetical protein